LKIWLNASAETGGKRIFNDEKNRTSEKYATEEEAVEEIKKRNTADRNRYITVYKVEIYPNSESVEGIEQVEYDKIVDADSITTEQVKQEIFEFLNEKGLKPSKKLIN
jgi:cytidylate kinase